MAIPLSRRLGFTEVPVIDLTGAVAGNFDRSVIDRIDAACRDVGFFYVSGHGMDSRLIEDLVEQGKQFFQLPDKNKRAVLIDSRIRGYLPLYYRSYEGEDRAGISRQEGFWIGHESTVDPRRPMNGPNQWPLQPARLKKVMNDYLAASEALAAVIGECFARAMGVQPDDFLAMFEHPTSRLKINHYPPQRNPRNINDIGVVPHCDSGAYTLLWQDHNGGLEVLNKDDEWVEVPPIDGTLVVNLGYVMQYWSNGEFGATPHRVINRGGRDRYSIPLFVNPNPDVEIECLIQGQEAAFEPFNYGHYQQDVWRKTFPIAAIP